MLVRLEDRRVRMDNLNKLMGIEKMVAQEFLADFLTGFDQAVVECLELGVSDQLELNWLKRRQFGV